VITLPPTTTTPATTTPTTAAPAPPPTAPPTTLPEAASPVVKSSTRFDADGNDNQNKNDEWVRFENGGSSPIDLTSWVVEDEGPNHRYTFGSLVLQPGEFVTLFSGCGTDDALNRYWCNSGSAVWNNDGDTVSLYDASGTLVAQRSG
jgi:competence protein ComEC